MPSTLDSHIVERHEDGSWTETVVVNGRPATKKENVIDGLVVGAMVVIGCAPLVYIFGVDWYERRQERKAEAAKLKSV